MVLIIGITGATGVIYGIRLLQVLSSVKNVETHLIISGAAQQNIKHETEWEINDIKSLADFCYDAGDIGARLASGSFMRDGMVIAPDILPIPAALQRTVSVIFMLLTNSLKIFRYSITKDKYLWPLEVKGTNRADSGCRQGSLSTTITEYLWLIRLIRGYRFFNCWRTNCHEKQLIKNNIIHSVY